MVKIQNINKFYLIKYEEGIKLKISAKDTNKTKLIIKKKVERFFVSCMKETRENYPISLKVKHMAEITNLSSNSIYLLLEKGKIPGAKKIKGWRVPRDTFLSWWFGSYHEKAIKNAN